MLIGIDVTSSLASQTGVGVCVRELVQAVLASSNGSDTFRLCAVSARRDSLPRLRRTFPNQQVKFRVRRLPMRLAQPLADFAPLLSVEALFGPMDVFHANHLMVPVPRRTAALMSVYDLTPILFPEFYQGSNRFTRIPATALDRSGGPRDREFPVDIGRPPESRRSRCRPDPGCPAWGAELLSQDPRGRGCRRISRSPRTGSGLHSGRGFAGPTQEPAPASEGFPDPAGELPGSAHTRARRSEGLASEGILRAIRELRLQEAVRITGFVEDRILNVLYNRAAVLVYPTLYEGFGLPPLEAMAAGCPVAVSNSSSIPEVVGEAGLYFDPEEPEAIASAVHRILDSPGLRSKLVQSGLERAQSFPWQNSAERMLAVYAEAREDKEPASDMMTTRLADRPREEVIIERRSVSAPFDNIVRNLNPVALARNLWTHRDLVRQFTGREIAGRYKGSFFGLFWSFFHPLVLLLTYTFVFGLVFRARWGERGSTSLGEFSLVLFSGLIAFNVFSESVNRSAGLIPSVPNYVKKVVFPLEILPVSVLGSALFHAPGEPGNSGRRQPCVRTRTSVDSGFAACGCSAAPFPDPGTELVSGGARGLCSGCSLHRDACGSGSFFLTPIFYPLTLSLRAFEGWSS